ncbi:MAG TPA: NADH:flavin oxidoreductase/NADH oxidase [Candidatus Acidoferrales bacterium]|nr:NADH:flavin oxidoreductase/NADH oxidase [Candidatus Acidoferrales bacterium]
MPSLFEPLPIREVVLKNRIGVSPMCQYSSTDGFANDWHLVHLGSRAVGGAALVFTEATAVTPEGRISPQDLGIWSDEHIPNLARIVEFIHGQKALAGMQLAHAGRKASMTAPFEGGRRIEIAEGGWTPLAPSAVAFSDSYAQPRALSTAEISRVVEAFLAGARRARKAGFDVLELHFAHGYLVHEFLSPLSNKRNDEYGGSFENRVRFACELATAVRAEWPRELPLLVRISATDYADGGWDLEQSVQLAGQLQEIGVDLIDCSSGGLVPNVLIPTTPGYQVEFSRRIREETGILTGAVGLISKSSQADEILSTEQADMIFMAREFLRDPYWPLRTARDFGFAADWPAQYLRAAPPESVPRTPIYPTRSAEAEESKVRSA